MSAEHIERIREKGEHQILVLRNGGQEIEQVLRKFVEFVTSKEDEAPIISSVLCFTVHTEPVQEIELMPNNIKLEGTKR